MKSTTSDQLKKAKKPKRRAVNLRLRQLRFEAGLSQRHLASLAGLSPAVANLAERGWTPHPGNAHALLEVLERKLDRQIAYVEVWPLPGEKRS